MTNAWSIVLSLLVALGGAGGLVMFLRWRQQGGAEKDSIIAEAAERAVLSMERSLGAARTEIHDLRQQLTVERNKRLLMEARVARFEEETAALRTMIRALEREGVKMHEELAELRAAQGD
jgi:predicted RNase H-like nuclease (RuvC/YqgF family)